MFASPTRSFDAESFTGTLPRPSRCSTCSSIAGIPNHTPRHLVVCIDGTANKFGRNNTNVVKLFGAVDTNTKEPKQYTFYSSGIGTRPRIFNLVKRMQRDLYDIFDMAVAWNVEEIVKDAYAWLAGKYQEGDQIYLFGFSRGAYQVRILAGMIYEAGLIKNPTEKQIGVAYDHFTSILSHQPNAHDMARKFKLTFSWEDVRVHFIGVWDTVSSVGFDRANIYLSGSSAAAHACHIRHALALDDRRVKYVPEYFLEMNSPNLSSPPEDAKAEFTGVDTRNEDKLERHGKAEDIINRSAPRVSETSTLGDVYGNVDSLKPTASNAISYARHISTQRSNRNTTDVKEVWFAGCHSDVGGTHQPGRMFHAGNVSLMWMRREASNNGLILKPGELLWTDEDLDLGTTDSMTFVWKLFEFIPFKHQVSFRGAGENARKLHLFKPRRIIPGQKIHASVQFANTYVPRATFGNGFGNPLETAGPMPSKEDDIWEKEAFDYTTYVTLFDYLTGRQGDAPFYLHKLLFMLRFTEGRSPATNVPGQQKTLIDLITKQSGMVRLVAIAVYFEALDSFEFEDTFLEDVFREASQSFMDFMEPDQPDWPRAVALLRPIAKHEKLRHTVLVDGVINGFLQLLDHTIDTPGEHFAHVMDALSSLVEHHPNSIINKLVEPSCGTTQRDRLSLMLDIDDPRHLTAVLRVVILLSQQAPHLCLKAKPRLHELAEKRDGPVSLLAVEALVGVSHAELYRETNNITLALPIEAEPGFAPLVGQNPASSTQLRYLHASTPNISPSRNWMRIGDSLLYKIFSTGPLGDNRRKFIKQLLEAASGRRMEARTSATFTLLKLREVNNNIEAYLLAQGYLDIFIKQLQYEDSALLAAYALTKCLNYDDLGMLIDYNPLIVGYIVNMIRLDYFDEAIGIIDGFTIFEDLLRCDTLKRRILGYDIATLLERKLGGGKPGEMRTSMIYLNIFRIHGEHSLTRNLVERGMIHMRTDRWRTQKAGVAILCSLAKTWFGIEPLKQIISEVIDMLLPTHHLDRTVNHSRQSKPPSSLLGPTLVMRVLAENEILRNEILQTPQYGRVKHLYMFGDLLGVKETPIWQVRTPTRDDVLDAVNQMIHSVESVEGSTSAGFILPRIRHWDRVVRAFRDGVLEMIVMPSVIAGGAVLVVTGAIVLAPLAISRKILQLIGHPWRLQQQNAIIRSLKLPDPELPTGDAPPLRGT